MKGVSVINGSFFPGMKTRGFRISLKTRKINKQFLQKLDEVLACSDSRKLLPSREDI
jgi:histidinol-phosphate/aromatic aminotransferase/cobyric acid decarboxylase-like protein